MDKTTKTKNKERKKKKQDDEDLERNANVPTHARTNERRKQKTCQKGSKRNQRKQNERNQKNVAWNDPNVRHAHGLTLGCNGNALTFATNVQNFDWGHRDGHHTWHKPTSGSWLSDTQKALERSGGPTNLQNLLLTVAAVAAVTLGVAGGNENAELTTICTVVLMVCLTGSTIAGGLRESN